MAQVLPVGRLSRKWRAEFQRNAPEVLPEPSGGLGLASVPRTAVNNAAEFVCTIASILPLGQVVLVAPQPAVASPPPPGAERDEKPSVSSARISNGDRPIPAGGKVR